MADLGILNTNAVYTELDSPISSQILGTPTTRAIYTEVGSRVPSQQIGATTILFDPRHYVRYIPWQFQQANGPDIRNTILNGDVTGTISGAVQIDGIAVAGVEVALFERQQKQLLARQKTKSDGSFVFSNLLVDTIADKGYFVVAFDADGLPLKNAKIYDYLTPV